MKKLTLLLLINLPLSLNSMDRLKGWIGLSANTSAQSGQPQAAHREAKNVYFLENHPNKRFKKVKVLNHNEPDNGGEGSSAYHAIKNGFILARYSLALQVLKEKFLKQLQDSEIAQEYVSSICRLRHVFGRERFNLIINYQYYNFLLGILKGNVYHSEFQQNATALKFNKGWISFEPIIDDPQFKQSERTLLRFLLMDIAQKATLQSVGESGLPKFHLAKLENAIESVIQIYANHSDRYVRSTAQSLLVEKKYRTYFQSPNSQLEQICPLETHDFLINLETQGARGKYFDWLLPLEMYKMPQEFIPEDIRDKIHLFLLDDPTETNIISKITDNEVLVKDALDLRKPETISRMIFFIRRQEKWFCMLVHKEKDELPHYYLADSNNNALSVRDTFFQALIEVLEKTEFPAKPTGELFEKLPYADLDECELPSLKDLFNGEIPFELKILMEYLKNKQNSDPNLPQASQISCPQGLLLSGKPGTGKTLIADLIARELKRKVIYRGGGRFQTVWKGSARATLEDMFKKANEVKPCFIFIDEIDGIVIKKENQADDHQGLNVLLETMNFCKGKPDIFFIATTNHPELIEPSVLSRFTYNIEVPLPNLEARRNMFVYYTLKNKIKDVYWPHRDILRAILYASAGFSGRDLENMVWLVAAAISNKIFSTQSIPRSFLACANQIFSEDHYKYNLMAYLDRYPLASIHGALSKVSTIVSDYCEIDKTWFAAFDAIKKHVDKNGTGSTGDFTNALSTASRIKEIIR